MEALGHRIREARKAAGLTQEALARAAGVNLRSIQNWEHGEHQPMLDSLVKIAEATGKDLDFFVLPQTSEVA
jgi:transcriptional regulator with XRE-family HTH domain